jgi:hypothetical protein
MSHIVTIAVEVRDLDAIKLACCRLGLGEPVFGKAELLERELEGVLVKLPEWVFPVVCDLDSGEVHFDNFNGKWGDRKYLDKFVQTYTVEKVRLESRRKGYSVIEQSLSNGSIKVSINTGLAT